MKDIIICINEGLKKKGIVRVFFTYDKSKDVYGGCITVYGYEKTLGALGKIAKLPSNCRIDEITEYEDVYEITTKEAE